MDKTDLIVYFLEKEGFDNPKNTKEEKDQIINNFLKDSVNRNSKVYKTFNLLEKFDELWSSGNEIYDEETIKLQFEGFKKVVTNLIKLVPDDYYLKADLTFNGIDYETFDEYSFEYFRWKKREYEFDFKTEEIEENDSLSDDKKIEEAYNLLKDFELRRKSDFNENARKKLYTYLDELDVLNKKYLKKNKINDDFDSSLYGKMYIFICGLIKDLLDHEDKNKDIAKEKEELFKKYLNHDFKDGLEFQNECGFLAYQLKDTYVYNKINERNKFFNKRGLIPYFLKNIDKIFQNDNDKYIKKIIKENFLFFPCLIFNEGMNKFDEEIIYPSKGSEKEAYKLIEYCNLYLKDLFDKREDILIKDYMKNMKDYFNFYFEDEDLTYFLFRCLEDEYMSSEKEIYMIEDLKTNFNIKTKSTDEEFEKCFKNLCNAKLIKKANQFNYQIKDGFDTILDLDLGEKDFENSDEEYIDENYIEGLKA